MSTFTVHLDDRTSEALRLAAAHRNRTEEEVISDFLEKIFTFIDSYVAVERVDGGDGFSLADVAAIEEGIAQLRRGEGIPHEIVVAEMRAKFAK